MRFRRTLTFLILALAFALTAGAQQKPFTQEQVSNMVRAGLGDDSGTKLIEQRGIDFAPSEDFYQTLKAAGATEAFLKALRAAIKEKPPSTNERESTREHAVYSYSEFLAAVSKWREARIRAVKSSQ
jgi:hypothetical protein